MSQTDVGWEDAAPLVLAVVSDQRTRELVEAAFEPRGWQIEMLARGPEVVSLLEGVEPALLLVGLEHPDGRELELIARVRDLRPGLPIVALGADEGAATRALASAIGAREVVPMSSTALEVYTRATRHSNTRVFDRQANESETTRLRRRADEPKTTVNRRLDLTFDARGRMFGRFAVQRELGRGGFGIVLEARDETTGREVALKVLRPIDDDDARRRFADEIRHLRGFDHPHVVQVLDHGTDGQVDWCALRRVKGSSLRDHVRRRGRLDERQAVTLLRALGSALAALDERGLVHRDIKPSNILLEGGDPARPVLIDFGLSRRLADPSLTDPAILVGTAGYVAPEVIEGAVADIRSDLYALGLSVVFALTGVEVRATFSATDRHRLATPGRPVDVPAGLSPGLTLVLRSLTHKVPQLRPANPQGLLAMLDEIERP